MLTDLFINNYSLTKSDGKKFNMEFQKNCIVKLPNFLNNNAVTLLQSELSRISKAAIRRDFTMEGSNRTSRNLSTLGGQTINRHSSLIPMFYEDNKLLQFLSGIAGEEFHLVPDPIENYVINILHEKDDIHGAHVDTYAFAFIIAIETPHDNAGGILEMVPNSTSIADMGGPNVERVTLKPGDCYLLRSDKAIHRVSPLLNKSRRTVINFAYANQQTVELESYSSSVLYGEKCLEV